MSRTTRGLFVFSGLTKDDVKAGAANDPKRNANANSSRPTPGGHSQQTLLAAGSAALKGKSRSPSRRHTFNGTATFFGDEFNTAPSIFIAGASGRIGVPAPPGTSTATVVKIIVKHQCQI